MQSTPQSKRQRDRTSSARKPSMSMAADGRTVDLAGRTRAETKSKLSLNIVFPLLGGRSTWSHEHLLPIFVSLIVALMLMAVPLPGLQLISGSTPATPGSNEAWQVFSIL